MTMSYVYKDFPGLEGSSDLQTCLFIYIYVFALDSSFAVSAKTINSWKFSFRFKNNILKRKGLPKAFKYFSFVDEWREGWFRKNSSFEKSFWPKKSHFWISLFCLKGDKKKGREIFLWEKFKKPRAKSRKSFFNLSKFKKNYIRIKFFCE